MDRWKIISVLFLALALIAGLDGQVQAEERIHDYHSDIQILNDGSLRVTETITVNAEGQKIKRGIYRDFPIAYTSRYMVPIKLPFHVESVKRNGKTESFHTKTESNGVRVYVGREDYLLPPGKYTFELPTRRISSWAISTTTTSCSVLQNDVLSPVARRLLPLMLRIEPREERARRAVKLLSSWNHSMQRERAEPLIYTAWLRQLIVALINDELGPKLVDGYLKFSAYSGLGLVEAALTNDPQWCNDIASTELETCENLLEMALQRALDEIATELGSDMDEWRWGDLHRATFTHRILTNVPIVRWFADLSIASDGGDHTVNRGTTPPARPGNSFPHIDGAGYRAVYDLANLDNSTFMIATGQSGNVLSRHYDDLLRRWRDGQYIRITENHDDVQKSAIGTLLLVPAGVSSLPKED